MTKLIVAFRNFENAPKKGFVLSHNIPPPVSHLNNFFVNSEVCHLRCVFKLYGEVCSVKNTTINIWLNDGVYWQWKNYMFRPIAAIIKF